MSIKPSAGSEIRGLVQALGAADDITREAAIARLSVIGSRAIDRLAMSWSAGETTRPTRLGILRVLEAIGDPRAIPIARRALEDGGDVAVAASVALRPLVQSRMPGVSAQALDVLMATVLNRELEHRVRAAAFDALQDLPEVREKLRGALDDPPHTETVDAVWQDVLDGRLPDTAGALREAMLLRAGSAPVSALQKLIDAVRAREESGHGGAPEWRAIRGALHQALALRGSRVAAYDLREAVEAAPGPLPSTFLTALHLVGDESCLPPIAAAHARAPGDERWRQQLEGAFHAIVKREKLSRKPVAKLLRKPRAQAPR